MKKNIGFIGTGKMAEALINCFKKSELVGRIIGSDKNDERLKEIEKKIHIDTTTDNNEVVNKSDIVFLSIKPQDMEGVLKEIRNEIKDQIIVSIAAGITMSFIQRIIGNKKIIRVMPNTPCLVGEMAAGFAKNTLVDTNDEKFISKLLNSAGIAFLLEEHHLDAVTGLSGSGPAFVAYLIKEMAIVGNYSGLPKEVAYELTLQTFLGTAKLLKETGITPDELIKMVSSPGGTTVAGREILEKSDVREIIEKTIAAATKRSKELGRGQ